MANLDYNLDNINKGIEGGIAYLDNLQSILNNYGEGDDKGTLKALIETIDAAINGYITANPSIQDITDNNLDNCVKSGISYIKVTKNTINAPEKPTDDTELYAYLLVLKFGTVTSQFFIFTNNGKYYYRRQNNTTWSEWFNFIQDGPLSTTWEKMKRGLQSQTGFNMAGHNKEGNYDYNLALVNNQNSYGLKDDTKMILYKNKDSDHFIYDGELKNVVPINKGGSGLAISPKMRIDLESEESVNIMGDEAPEPGVKGKLPLNHGGTNNNLSNMPPYAIVRRVSKTKDEFLQDRQEVPPDRYVPDYKYLYYTPTKKGAFFALGENGEPNFGTLPIDCGGTGYGSNGNRDEMVSHLTKISDYDYSQLFGLWGKAQKDSTKSELVKQGNKLVLLIDENYLELYNRTQEKSLWLINLSEKDHTFVKRSGGDSIEGSLNIENNYNKTGYNNAYIILRGSNGVNIGKGKWQNAPTQAFNGSIYFGPGADSDVSSSLARIASYREISDTGRKYNTLSFKSIENVSGSSNATSLNLTYDSGTLNSDKTKFNSVRQRIWCGEDTYFHATRVYASDFYIYSSGGAYHGTVSSNDYAEYRKTIDLTPGHVVVDNDDGSLRCSNQRLQPGAQVISDTFGYTMGESEDCKTPLAVSGRVLAYTYQPRENYHAGMAVCSAPDGTIDIMTREEIRNYPDCIIGIVSEIPQYEIWGDNVKVDGRIWIKIK